MPTRSASAATATSRSRSSPASASRRRPPTGAAGEPPRRLRAEQLEANERLAPFVAEERLGELRGALAELVEAAKET